MRSLKVKVCGMRDAANIDVVASLRPDYMGFIFVPSSPRYVDGGHNLDIGDLPHSIVSVGVFQDAPVDFILERVLRYQLKAVQLHGYQGVSPVVELREQAPHVSILRAISVTSGEDLQDLSAVRDEPDLYVFDGSRGGSGVPFDWGFLKGYRGDVPFLLAGGIGPTNLHEVFRVQQRDPRLVGVDINSKVETIPGVKNPDMIQEVMERLSV